MCNHLGSITMGISLSVCLYCCMWEMMGSSVSNPAMKSHMFGAICLEPYVGKMVPNVAGLGIG